jgi:hypothetical protein
MQDQTVIKSSGSCDSFATGAVRDTHEGKGRMDLLPVRAILEVSKIFEAGAKRYAARNWEKGINLSRYMDSGLRHIMKWLRGDRDEPHLTQAIWNFMCLQDTQLRIADGLLPMELNDLPYNPIELTPEGEILINNLMKQTRKSRHFLHARKSCRLALPQKSGKKTSKKSGKKSGKKTGKKKTEKK